MPDSSADRRRHRRFPVAFLVQHQADVAGVQECDYASDLSQSGIFIRTTSPAAAGAVLQVQFSPQKDSHLVQAFCRVRRVTPAGMAAEFLQMDTDSAGELSRALAS